MSDLKYRQATLADIGTVTALLCKLYDCRDTIEELSAENEAHFANPTQAFFLAFDGGLAVGVTHVAVRRDYVEGALGDVCGYLEAVYTEPVYRNQGIARRLVAECETWAVDNGCTMFASDCDVDNTDSLKFHLSIGFTEVNRSIHFAKRLNADRAKRLTITALTPENRALVDDYLAGEWGADFVVSRGRITKISECKGFLAESDGGFLGAVLYEITGDECEVAVLDCRRKGVGAGTALLDKVIEIAKDENCRRVWLVTSNDNIDAIRFYQKRGWNLAAVYIDAMDAVRKLKPAVPLIGENGIPLRHELEFEVKLQ